MKSWKKLLAAVSALVLLLALLPVTALAEEIAILVGASANYSVPNEDGYCFTPKEDGLYTFEVRETTLASSGNLQVFAASASLDGTAASDALWTWYSYTVPLRAGKSYTVFHAAENNGTSYSLSVLRPTVTTLSLERSAQFAVSERTPIYFSFTPSVSGEYRFHATAAGKLRAFDADMSFLRESDSAVGVKAVLNAGQVCYAALEPSADGNGALTVTLERTTEEPSTAPTTSTEPPEEPEPNNPISFKDVASNAWYAEAVNYAVKNGLMNGMGGGRFEPETPMSRAMLVTVLWRYAGSPKETGEVFRDVPKEMWYTDAVAWASHHRIVGGIGGGRFDPDSPLTREQLATILFRYANACGMETANGASLNAFADSGDVSGYAREAISWAVSRQIISGMPEGSRLCLAPQGSATRAQVATILMRFIQNAK